MANVLVTGVPGAGKTLFAVSEVIAKMAGETVELDDGSKVKRRLCIGGIRDLLIEHEPIDVPTFDQEQGKLRLGGRVFEPETDERKPGEPPHDCERRADNWWRWCQPGDLIVIDECQRLLRPMAAGRKAPKFITQLETHRHYGVDFLFITQHPQLVHSNVRNLVNVHRHVRRMFGGAQTVVYEWDCCTNPDRVKNATKRPWRHKKAAFKLYKSAEVHTKTKQRIPLAVYMVAAGFIAVPVMAYQMKGRIESRYAVPAASAASAPAQATTTRPDARDERPAGAASSSPGLLASAAGAVREAVASPPAIVGCISMGARCECIEDTGRVAKVALEQCVQDTRRLGLGIGYAVKADRAAAARSEAVPMLRDAEPIPTAISLGGDPRAHIRQ